MPDECGLYADPKLYDALFPSARHQASERFYIEEARTSGGPVLEVGCGSGRLTIPIAQNGVEICGVDLSASMLEAARANAQGAGLNIEFVQADMRTFDLGRRFSAILVPGNSLLHMLTNEDLQQCLAAMRRHLTANGRLIFDVSKWDLARLIGSANSRPHAELSIEESSSYDSVNQIRNIRWYVSNGQVIEYRLRVIFPQELRLLLETSGFRLDTRYGEFTREPFADETVRQVCICSLRSPSVS